MSTLTAAWPPEDTLDPAAMTAARWAYSHIEPAGADTGTLPIIPWYFVPLRIGTKTLGVVGVAKEKNAAADRFGGAGFARHARRADCRGLGARFARS